MAIGYWLLVTGYWLLVIGYWLLVYLFLVIFGLKYYLWSFSSFRFLADPSILGSWLVTVVGFHRVNLSFSLDLVPGYLDLGAGVVTPNKFYM